jgi:hypothetical protein
MFDNKMKAIEMCVARFDSETKATFLDLYTKVDAEALEETTIEECADEGIVEEENEVQAAYNQGVQDSEDYYNPGNEENVF